MKIMCPEKANELIIVACHAAFKNSTTLPLNSPADDNQWVLLPFQKGEPKYYLEHMKYGTELLNQTDNSILIFSGGNTRKESGSWTEANSYLKSTQYFNLWLNNFKKINDVTRRIFLEEYARDSFENLLFSICRFNEITSSYPEKITLISWSFKKERFTYHAKCINYPLTKFHFPYINNPENLLEAISGEKKTVSAFKANYYGSTGELLKKRKIRNPFNKPIPYYKNKDLAIFFKFINDLNNSQDGYIDELPW
ncbi:MAG: hypothetical protein GY756_07640 [bacterium]|nr:hypothetical protein [bacterium]